MRPAAAATRAFSIAMAPACRSLLIARATTPTPTSNQNTASLYTAAAKMSGIEKIKVANPVVDLDGDEMTR